MLCNTIVLALLTSLLSLDSLAPQVKAQVNQVNVKTCFTPGPNTCKPLTIPLVDIFKHTNAPYGNVTYQWDLNKNLYATIRLNTKKYPDAKLKTSSFYIWSDATLQGYPNYILDDLNDLNAKHPNQKQIHTCATFTIPMSNVCNPINCRASGIPTCAPYKDKSICKNADLRYYMVVYTQPIATITIMKKDVTIGAYGIGNPDGIVPLDNTVSCASL